MSFLSRLTSWFGRAGAIGESTGVQNPVPGSSLVPGLAGVGVDAALQISTVWACIERRASVLASLPYFVYEDVGGKRTIARTSRLYALLHDSPNSRMTPYEFWRAIVMNHDLRGAGYARIERDAKGEAYALWPMPTDQVLAKVLSDGSMVYQYTFGGNVAILAEENVFVVKGLGNGTVGLDKLEYMRATVDEAAKAQASATKVFATGGKPTGVLMIDQVLKPGQRDELRKNFSELAEGNTSRIAVLEANMKYQQLSLSASDQQLLETRKFSVEEICRWFDVPPVLVHNANVTAWGTGIFEIKDGFYTLAIAPLCVNIQQALRKRVMTAAQRARYTGEFSMDALMRASIKDRFEIYAKATQNGLKTRNECRQLENDPPLPGGDVLTAQANLLPLDLLGKVKPISGASDATSQNPQAQ